MVTERKIYARDCAGFSKLVHRGNELAEALDYYTYYCEKPEVAELVWYTEKTPKKGRPTVDIFAEFSK